MYHESVILQKLADHEAENGWPLEYHSLEWVIEFTAYVKSIIEVKANSRNSYIGLNSKLTKSRADWVRRMIQNEQLLCTYDAGYWETRYAYITDNKSEIFKFENRKSQEIFDSIIADFDLKGVAIELMVLKARQLGVSTKVALKFLHRLLFLKTTQALMSSVNAEKSELLGRMAQTCLEHLPFWLIPRKTRDAIKSMEFSNGSILSIQSGSQSTGLAQGWTPSCVHICLIPETLVRCGNGRVEEIRFCEAGTQVFTGGGIPTKVKALTLSHRINEITAELTPWGFYEPQSTTLDHPVMTEAGFVQAGSLKVGDEVLYPARKITNELTESRVEHITTRAKKVVLRQNVVHDYDLGWVCGLYIAEGHIHVNAKLKSVDSVTFSMHEKEVDRNLLGLTKVFRGHKLRAVALKGSKTRQITVYSSGWARWFNERFGRVKNKHITDDVLRMGGDFCRGLLCGYLEGDGYIAGKKVEIVASTVRKEMAFQLRDLTIALGFGLPSMFHREAGVFYNRRCQELWTLQWPGSSAERMRKCFGWPFRAGGSALHWRYSPDGGSIFVKLKKVERGFSEEFYDLEVEHSDHTFCTAQMGVKNSEIGDIPNPKKVLEEGLFKATHPTHKLFAVYEGTGNGNTGWQADKWRGIKEDWPRGRARICPIFLSWPTAPDQYPEPDWIKKFPIPSGWNPHAITRKHILRCELYIRNTPYLAKVMGKDWKMPRDQQWYWEFNYDEAVRTHTTKVWLSQMPADDHEALQGKNDIIFDDAIIIQLQDTRKMEFQDYAITGDSVDEGFEPNEDEINYEEERIQVEWVSNRGVKYEWTMIPLLPCDEDKDDRQTMGRVRVFEHPRPNQDYTFGIDTADGLGFDEEDRSVCSGTRSMTGDECDEQVFEFVHNRVNSPQMVSFAACLAAYYSQDPRRNKIWTADERGIKFCIEQRERAGDDCQLQLKLMGFNYHQNASIQFDSKNPSETKGQLQGFRTNNTTRPILTGRFVDAINNGWYKPHSRWLIEEAKTWERKKMSTGKTRMDHQSGKHDDRVLAAALSYFARHTFDIMAERSTKRYNIPTGKNPDIEYKHVFSDVVSIGAW